MPTRKRRHMAVFRGVMMAQAAVETDATTSGGWIGWMAAKMIPAAIAARPVQRMICAAVGFICASPSARCLPHRDHTSRRIVNGVLVALRLAGLLWLDLPDRE